MTRNAIKRKIIIKGEFIKPKDQIEEMKRHFITSLYDSIQDGKEPHCLICGDVNDLVSVCDQTQTEKIFCNFCFCIQESM